MIKIPKCIVCNKEYKNYGIYFDKHVEYCKIRISGYIDKAIERYNTAKIQMRKHNTLPVNSKSFYSLRQIKTINELINSMLQLHYYYNKYKLFINSAYFNRFPNEIKLIINDY
jgi:hypothetical protein